MSKSMLMLAWAVALAMGRKYHGLHPKGRFRVTIYNVEDDDDEQKRRLTAVLTRMGLTPADIEKWVMRTGPRKVGTLLTRDLLTRRLEPTEAWTELVANLRDFATDVVILDPLAELHTEDENSNGALREVVARFRALAREMNMAIVIVHHTRKGIVMPGDMEAARGASSVVSAARIGLTLVSMTEEDEKGLSLPAGSRKHYVRLDGGKSNYTRLTECEWFERQSYDLGQGDNVGIAVPWHPPMDVVTLDKRALVEASIRRGSSQGPYSPQLGNNPRSIKAALLEAGLVTSNGQKDLLADLLKAGFVKVKYHGPDRKLVNGIRSPDGQPSNVVWEDASGGTTKGD